MQRVWVTRDEKADGPLCSALQASHLTPVLEPVLERKVVADIATELQSLGVDDWLVLTSVFAIENMPSELASIPQLAVVGEASKAAAEARGFRVKLVSTEGTGLSLFEELRKRAAGKCVVYPRSALAKIPTDLNAFANFSAPILYETNHRHFSATVVQQVDVISVTSASAVRALDQQIRLAPLELPIASIGVTTTAAVEECGGTVWVQPMSASFAELARAISKKLEL